MKIAVDELVRRSWGKELLSKRGIGRGGWQYSEPEREHKLGMQFGLILYEVRSEKYAL
jgi:hypothetical protein